MVNQPTSSVFLKENKGYALITIVISFLLIINTPIIAQYNGIFPKSYYLELGVGTSVINHSHIKEMEPSRLPIHLYVEAGKFFNRFAITAGYDFFTGYTQNNYELSPSFGFAHLKLFLWDANIGKMNVSLFGFAGPTFGSTSLTDEGNNTVLNYELKKEKEMALGLSTGVGGQLEWRKWVFAMKAIMIRSKAYYIAGGFSEQEFQTGSDRIQLTIGYRLSINGEYNEKNCPTYL